MAQSQKLSPEELQELAALEQEEADQEAERKHARKRQHLEALKLKNRLSKEKDDRGQLKHGLPGVHFDVFESTSGNIAFKKPHSLQIDLMVEKEKAGLSREDFNSFAAEFVIEPDAKTFARWMAESPTLGAVVVSKANALIRVFEEYEQEETAKK